ncbi:serine/threonine-protein kinase [Bacillus hominis]|uniref:serine/threonine-protein kinase n=1 Tax=Bacillus hominis TaxID=2817478 RepID=UPI0025A20617|nr:serine/threonine-protein kinase [Bacillus hominis]MDA1967652.1 serine/threonine-protein kinase [Bacillus cereus]MDM5193241.1 serine/threonine-protein kinase [Bacillus hominis]
MATEPRTEPYMFQVQEHLGDGGFGNVYRANGLFDDDDDVVAIKVLKTDQLTPSILNRFNREIRIHSKLKHVNIVPIIEFELDDSLQSDEGRGLAYYTMPLGTCNFRTFLYEYRQNNFGNMDDETAVYYFNQILDGIEYAHSEEIIHRDLKPENIIVYRDNERETLKIADFGLGKFLHSDATMLTQTRMALGTDTYAAPEQRGNSRDVDERADIYSLGKILYEMLTYDIPHVIDYERIPHSKLRYIIRKATQTNKERRFNNIQELKEQLNLAMGYTNTAKNLSMQFNELYIGYINEDNDLLLKEICDLLLKNNNDYILYTEDFMRLDESTISAIYANSKYEFYEIVENYFSIADGGHIYSFTDKICDFIFNRLLSCLKENMDLYERAFETVLCVGYNHNRFYIARRFAREIEKLSEEDTEYKMIVGDVLANHEAATKWVRYYVHEDQLCGYLATEIAKY